MRSMDSLILSIGIALALGLAGCGKDNDEPGEQPDPDTTSALSRPGQLERPPSAGKVPADLRPPR